MKLKNIQVASYMFVLWILFLNMYIFVVLKN